MGVPYRSGYPFPIFFAERRQKKISTAIPNANSLEKEINPQKRTAKVHTNIG
jgi:hypothetical protein